MPSILIVNRVFPPMAGATGRLARDLAQAMVQSGWSVRVLCCGEPGNGSSSPGPIEIRRIGASEGRSLHVTAGQVAALARALPTLPQHDVTVLMSDPPLLSLLAPVAAMRSTAVVHWCHDLYPDLLPIVAGPAAATLGRALRPLVTAALRRCDGIVAIGRCMATRLRDQVGDPRTPAAAATAPPITVVPNWADPAVTVEDRPPPTGGPLIALYSGTLGRVHPVAPLHRLGAALARRQGRLVVAGAGPAGTRFARQAAIDGVDVTARPWVASEHLSRHLATPDLHVAVLDRRAVGLSVPCKVASAVASGRPVLFLGPRDSEAAHLLAETGRGITVDPDLPIADLATAVERTLALGDRAPDTGVPTAVAMDTGTAALRAAIGSALGRARVRRGRIVPAIDPAPGVLQ